MKKGKSAKPNKSALSSALSDLDSEMKRLSQERMEMQTMMRKAARDIDSDQESQKNLQKKIAILAEKEARLVEKKKSLQMKSDALTDKMGKISKIKSEMSDI